MDARHRVVFAPSGLSVTVDEGTTVLDAARQAGADLDSTCGGRGLCGRCQVVPTAGSFSKWQIESTDNSITGWASTEENYTGRRPILDRQRLGCAAQVCGDVVVEIPAASQVHKQVVRKSVDLGDIEVDPLVRLHYIELPKAELGAELGGLSEQIGAALLADYDVTMARLDAHVLPLIADAAKRGDNAITVGVRRGCDVCAVYPGYVDRSFGVAVDVGSTTVAGHLVDLATGEVVASNGVMNPQIRFGDDLMSRVSYVMMNPGGDVELTRSIRAALNTMVGELVDDAATSVDTLRPIDRTSILDMTLVGNPIMHHVILGIDPTPLGQAPFLLATDSAVTVRATDLEIDAPSRRRISCRALPATSVPTLLAPSWLKVLIARTRCNSSSTSAPMPRSCSATPSTCSLPPLLRAQPSKVLRSRRGCAQRRAPLNACASIATPSSLVSR